VAVVIKKTISHECLLLKTCFSCKENRSKGCEFSREAKTRATLENNAVEMEGVLLLIQHAFSSTLHRRRFSGKAESFFKNNFVSFHSLKGGEEAKKEEELISVL